MIVSFMIYIEFCRKSPHFSVQIASICRKMERACDSDAVSDYDVDLVQAGDSDADSDYGNEVVTIGNPSGGLRGDLIYGFQKEGWYTDVTLVFDDGKRISCHRSALASVSTYFDKLITDSSEDTIHMKGDF